MSLGWKLKVFRYKNTAKINKFNHFKVLCLLRSKLVEIEYFFILLILHMLFALSCNDVSNFHLISNAFGNFDFFYFWP